MVTSEGGLLQEKEGIASRQVMGSRSKQDAFAEEAKVEEVTPGIYDVTKHSTQFEKKAKAERLFYKEAHVDEVTPGSNDDEIKGSHKFDKKTMMYGYIAKAPG